MKTILNLHVIPGNFSHEQVNKTGILR